MPITSDIAPVLPPRGIVRAMKHGWRCKCPACGAGKLYKSYLKVQDRCETCAEDLHHQRADDAPAYFTILIVAHIVGAGILFMEQTIAPPTWMGLAFWLPATLIITLWMLPRVKGALVGYQWATYMHGFGPGEFEGADIPPAEPKPANAT